VDPAWRLRAGIWADAGLAPGLSAHLRFVVDTEATNHPWVRTRDLRPLGASHDLDEAYLLYRVGPAAFVLGRRFHCWGPEGLLLSSAAPAMDLLHAAVDLGPHRFQAFVGGLSSRAGTRTVSMATPLPDGSTLLEEEVELQRTLYGHRLDLSVGSFGRVGLSELALLARPQGGLELKYLNPVSLHALTQIEEDGHGGEELNVLHQVDAEVWRGAWHLHGAFLVDDLQLDGDKRRSWPDQLAWSAGLDRRLDSLPGGLLSYSYRRMGSWTFLHRNEGLAFEHYGRPLAAPEGPDMDRHRLGLVIRPGQAWRIGAQVERRRRGENRIWTEDSREGHAGEDYPRGVVEKRWVLSAVASWQRPPGLRLTARLQWQDIRKVDNGPGDESVWELRATAEIYGPALSWLLP